MSWVNDLASTFGLPGGVGVIATGMYAACVAAEKTARPEALTDIGRVLKDTAWTRTVRPSAIIERLFNWTFGERHFSWRCMTRSMCATIIYCLAMTIVLYFTETAIYHKFQQSTLHLSVPTIALEIVVVGFVSDYLALGKTRLLLRLNIDRYWSAAIGLVAMADIILSLAISFGIIVLFGLVVTLPSSMNMATQTFTMANMINIWVPLLLSTLFTSIWTILILISITAIKVLAPSHRFITWFFDVDKHPVQAIGIVAGTLVIVPSLIWSLMWAVI